MGPEWRRKLRKMRWLSACALVGSVACGVPDQTGSTTDGGAGSAGGAADAGSGNGSGLDGGATGIGSSDAGVEQPHAQPVLHLVTTGQGIIRGAGDDCRGACDVRGTRFHLVAIADGGWVLSGWSGACTGTDPCDLTLSRDLTVTAAFVVAPPPPLPVHTLRVSVHGSGTVRSDPAGIDCGKECSHAWTEGAVATLSATPSDGFRFAGWGGACSGTERCTVTLHSDVDVSATFVRQFRLRLVFSGSGRGSVTVDGRSCTSTCAIAYDAGSAIKVHADATADAKFMGWTGACGGVADCAVKLDRDVDVGAIFWPFPAYTVTGFGNETARIGGIDAQGNIVLVMAPSSNAGDIAYYRDAQTGALRQLSPATDAWEMRISPSGRIALTTFHWQANGDDAWTSYRLEGSGTWSPVRNLGGADGSSVSYIDDDGVVVGSSHVSGAGDQRVMHAYLDDGKAIYDLGSSERSSWAGGRDKSGRIFGQVWDSPYFARRAAVWEPDGIHFLGSFGGDDSFAQAMNAEGFVVGVAQDANHVDFGFIWDPKTRVLTKLGAIWALDINHGQAVVGYGGRSGTAGVLWFNGMVWDLNDLVKEETTALLAADHINDQGQITGTGMVRGRWGKYLLTPR